MADTAVTTQYICRSLRKLWDIHIRPRGDISDISDIVSHNDNSLTHRGHRVTPGSRVKGHPGHTSHGREIISTRGELRTTQGCQIKDKFRLDFYKVGHIWEF